MTDAALSAVPGAIPQSSMFDVALSPTSAMCFGDKPCLSYTAAHVSGNAMPVDVSGIEPFARVGVFGLSRCRHRIVSNS